VEKETGRLAPRRNREDRRPVLPPDDEDVTAGERGVNLRRLSHAAEPGGSHEERPGSAPGRVRLPIRDRDRAERLVVVVEHRRRLHLRRGDEKIRQGLRRLHGYDASRVKVQTPYVRIGFSQLPRKFFADRGTHLAAMVAYFALLSFVPLIFLALALFGLTGRADAGAFFVKEIKSAFPGTSLGSIIGLVHKVQNNAAALGIIGGVGLLWSSLSFFSALESALNVVYGLPNRRFLHGKGLAAALMSSVLVTLFVSLVIGAIGYDALKRNLGFGDSPVVAYLLSAGVSLVGVFVFLLAIYRWLPHTKVSWLEALPGAVLAALALEASFQVLPLFVRFADVNVTLRTLGGPAILLIWLYVMANLIVFGGEVNWWWRERRRVPAAEPAQPAPGAS